MNNREENQAQLSNSSISASLKNIELLLQSFNERLSVVEVSANKSANDKLHKELVSVNKTVKSTNNELRKELISVNKAIESTNDELRKKLISVNKTVESTNNELKAVKNKFKGLKKKLKQHDLIDKFVNDRVDDELQVGRLFKRRDSGRGSVRGTGKVAIGGALAENPKDYIPFHPEDR